MQVKTSELTDIALDWAVAVCALPAHDAETNALMVTVGDDNGWKFKPSTDWAQGGPIIEREGIRLHRSVTGDWWASPESDPHRPISGATPLVAAMRCYVASILGDTVDVPEELCK